ncbi:MAG: L-2-amino-thiazoline-4-carboxylic acid hydrolase [Spirochaetales bacterium]|nr:L-2-amino-thiazoline-4-carboxylic acid hydrolase [Spirochaetales bacterium]
MSKEDMVTETELITKFRAAVKDRATWFALLYREFAEVLPENRVEDACRKAIYSYGRLKASRDKTKLTAQSLLDNFVETGGAKIFEAEIENTDKGVLNKVHNCALVDAWREMGCSPEEVDLFCDIAMEGDRGRAEGHGINLELKETLAKNDNFCWICLSDSAI